MGAFGLLYGQKLEFDLLDDRELADLEQIAIRDEASSRLRQCLTLGRPLGCLKVASASRAQFKWTRWNVGALICVATCVLTIACAWALALKQFGPKFPVAVVLICAFIAFLAIAKLGLKGGRKIAVYENGLRFIDPQDKVGNHSQFFWSDVDRISNRVNVAWACALGKKAQLKLKFRLVDFSVTQKAHEMELVVDAATNEIHVARYLCGKLRCDIYNETGHTGAAWQIKPYRPVGPRKRCV